ncbi:uncharacterized protein LOC123696500 [Colias croceus]|uniref:uncharacterized protein LOC123696500 n=1 Tax=Colias crocea TaxID=72248 RepID=UPI001E27EDAF|nr:uncharacterized protein LOC123696500 [Colias croceus]
MSQSKLEKVVSELHKSIVELTKKVESLETIINEQNTLIKSQADSISKLTKQQATDSSTSKLQENNEVSLRNRPIRAARLRVPLVANDVRKKRDVLQGAASASDAASAMSASEDDCANSLAPMQNANTVIDANAVQSTDNNNWIQVKHKRPKNVMRGSAAPGNSMIEASERWKYYHLFYVKAGTTAEKITEHIMKTCKIDNCTVEVLKSREVYAVKQRSLESRCLILHHISSH